MAVSKSWQYTLVGVIVGFVAVSALFLFSGDAVVDLFVRALGKAVSIILELIRLKSH